jgi:metal-responsive CopG/Arc/MetJ family transcriptional regulator
MAIESVTEKAINLRLPESLLREIDDFGFSQRIRSRNEVIRMLIRDGLRAHGAKSSSADSASSTDRAKT